MKSVWLSALLMSAGANAMPSSFDVQPNFAPHTFDVRAGEFQLDGQPFLIRGGDMHYQRVPKAYWRARMRMLRAMGLNTLTTYIFWNVHEPKPGVFDFTGQLDIREYIRTAQEEGLWVILRPGPYVCAEWEFGGLPSWLLRERNLKVRTTDPRFMEPARRYLRAVAAQVHGLTVDQGGPIIMTQIENEYGSFGSDRDYLNAMRQTFEQAGFGGLKFTSDNIMGQSNVTEQLLAGSFPDLPLLINFGQEQNASDNFDILRHVRPDGVRMNSEYWFGWFDYVGGKHSSRDIEKGLANLEWMLSQNISVSLYMAHGGTNFGFMAGANMDRGFYRPDTTSYDYDAPISEAGHATTKFYRVRELIQRYTPGLVIPEVPDVAPVIAIPSIELTEAAPLSQLYGSPKTSKLPLSMEDVDQAYGLTLYRHHVKADYSGMMEIRDVRDYAWVSTNNQALGKLDRRYKEGVLDVSLKAGGTLDILVENMGRLNFTPDMINERKGITREVMTEAGPLLDWDIYSLPLDDLSRLQFAPLGAKDENPGAKFYRGTFHLTEIGDTYIDIRGWGKGVVYVNGHNLGRYWRVGPQLSLYCPGPWLQQGANEVVILELDQPAKDLALSGVQQPIWGQLDRQQN